jgi:hypothetical protein
VVYYRVQVVAMLERRNSSQDHERHVIKKDTNLIVSQHAQGRPLDSQKATSLQKSSRALGFPRNKYGCSPIPFLYLTVESHSLN